LRDTRALLARAPNLTVDLKGQASLSRPGAHKEKFERHGLAVSDGLGRAGFDKPGNETLSICCPAGTAPVQQLLRQTIHRAA